MQRASVIDLFCGVGGMSSGFAAAGFRIVAGFDVNEACGPAFEANHPGAVFRAADVLELSGAEIGKLFPARGIKVLIACCPCLPYSDLRSKNPRVQDEERTVIDSFALQIDQIGADVVVMENVDTLRSYHGGQTLKLMLDALDRSGYRVNASILNAAHFGVAQIRRRLVILAARDAYIAAPSRTHGADWSTDEGLGLARDVPTIASAIGDLPPLAAGGLDRCDPLHRCSGLAPLTLERVRATPEGGDWRDWPYHLREPRNQRRYGRVHRVHMGETFVQAYGRRRWREPSYTLTTRFMSVSCGYFMHPKQDRGFSIREGARLQGFPDDFDFHPRRERGVNVTALGKQIGNAVPPPLARAVADRIAGAVA